MYPLMYLEFLMYLDMYLDGIHNETSGSLYEFLKSPVENASFTFSEAKDPWESSAGIFLP